MISTPHAGQLEVVVMFRRILRRNENHHATPKTHRY